MPPTITVSNNFLFRENKRVKQLGQHQDRTLQTETVRLQIKIFDESGIPHETSTLVKDILILRILKWHFYPHEIQK